MASGDPRIMKWHIWAAGFLLSILSLPFAAAQQTSYYREAPALAAEAATGRLPPVDRRLPENPMLVEPLSTIGIYGGTWHMAMRDSFDHASLIRTIGYENLMRWTPDWSKPIPNVAQAVDVGADAREFRFTLRRGMRWSDGEPFTADDILFWHEDILLNSELTPSIPAWLIAGGKPVEVEKIDDVTVLFRFATPNSIFLHLLAAPEGAEPTSYPKHHLAKLLPKYNKELTGTDWADKFRAAFGTPGNIDDSTRWTHPDVPTLHAWVLKGAYGTANPLIAERNPYYWKVDPAGQQLPYIDRVSFVMVKSKRDAVDLALRGEIDAQTRHVRCCGAEVVEARPEYTQVKVIPTETSDLVIGFNLTTADPVLRALFSQRDFRIALSVGMNRPRLIESDPLLIPWQVAPLPQSRHYHERLATQYLDYDPDRANRLLDSLGYDRRDQAGWRIGPGGAPIAFKVISPVEGPRLEWLEKVAEDWRALGINASAQPLEREDFIRRLESDGFDVAAYSGDGGISSVIFPDDFVPTSLQSAWGLRWVYWVQDKEDPRAEVPPPSVQRQLELYDAIRATTDVDKQQDLMRQILDIAAEEFQTIGVVRGTFDSGFMRRDFRNAPDFLFSSWSYPEPAPTNPAQYFFDPAQP
jgi:peptide/nickel transport system substrate-binding protein